MEPETESKQSSDEYWQAYEQWKKLDIKLEDASKRATREEAHERRPSSEQP